MTLSIIPDSCIVQNMAHKKNTQSDFSENLNLGNLSDHFNDLEWTDVRDPCCTGVSLVLYQPEIPGNTGTLMRLSACWRANLELIGPLGFVWSDRHLKRAGMDYAQCIRHPFHASWSDYKAEHTNKAHRMIAVVPHAGLSYIDFSFLAGDHLIMGSESCGLPESIIEQCDATIHIPMVKHVRSLNLALASAIVWSEALRQTQRLAFLER